MEDMRSSCLPAKSSDRGEPKDSAPFTDDYAEIFEGIATACSIPFLDLSPSSVESLDADGSVDYSEIFGGFSCGDFAIDYEELFSEKKKTAESSGASSNGRGVDVETPLPSVAPRPSPPRSYGTEQVVAIDQKQIQLFESNPNGYLHLLRSSDIELSNSGFLAFKCP